MNNSVVILVSGGIDSSALIKYYIDHGLIVRGIHFQYDQPSAKSEINSVRKISEYYNIETDFVELGFKPSARGSEFIGRNAIFVLSALSLLRDNEKRLALGIHAGVSYYDSTEIFMSHCQNIIDGYFSGTVSLEAPFMKLNKGQIYEYAKQIQLPIILTYSCETQNTPCGTCDSCKDRRELSW